MRSTRYDYAAGVARAACVALAAGLCLPATASAIAPGRADTAITQANIDTTICTAGWSANRRPPSSFTASLKRRQLQTSGEHLLPSAFEEDHLIPLSLGGAPADPANLWPQPRAAADGWTAARKDALETRLHRLVCAGEIPLAEAQHAIATDWVAAYVRYGLGE